MGAIMDHPMIKSIGSGGRTLLSKEHRSKRKACAI
jgi:hypothetical protein